MKFLLFNAAVIAALVYLFGMDQSDLDAATDHLQTSADRLEEATQDTVDAALDGLRAAPAPRDAPARGGAEDPVAPVKAAEAPGIAPEANERQAVDPATAPKTDPTPETDAVASTLAKGGSEAAEGNDLPSPDLLPAVRDPAVAKRRAEVLGGVASADGAPSVALAEGEQLMSPEQRVRELHVLAEEMELLFVDKMAR